MALPEQIQTSSDKKIDKKTTQVEAISSVTEKAKTEEKKEKTEIIDKKLNTLEDKQYIVLEAKKKMVWLISSSKMWEQFIQKQSALQEKIPGFTLDIFAENISKPVGEYLCQTFAVDGTLSLDKDVLTSMSVGIQGAMMEALKNSWSEDATKLFDVFSKINFNKATDAFSWLFSTFGSVFHKAGNINYFYQLATRVQNCTQYLATHAKSWEMKGQRYKELTMPNEFRKLLASPVWDDAEDLRKKSLQEVWLHAGEWDTKWDEASFAREVLDVAEVNPTSLAAINKALPQAMNLLEKRGTYRTMTSELMAKVGGVLNMDLFGIWTVGTLLGISSPAKLMKKSKLANFVLRVMGFDGVEGLHREYVRDQITKQFSPEKKSVIKAFFAEYKEQAQKNTLPPDFLTTYKISLKHKENEAKLPSSAVVLKESLLHAVKGNEKMISLQTLRALKIPFNTVKNANKEDVLDESTFDVSLITQQVLDKYLATTLPSLAKKNEFMKEITSPDQFVLAVIGNLFAGSMFVEGVCIGVENPNNYLLETAVISKPVEAKILSDEKRKELKDNIQKELDKVPNTPLTAEMVISSCEKYPNVPVEYVLAIMKNDSTYGTQGLGAKTHNPWNVGNNGKDTKDWSTREDGVEVVVKNLDRRIHEYTTVYGKTPFPSLKYLADNIGPDGKGFLKGYAYKQPNPQRQWAYMWGSEDFSWSKSAEKISKNLAQAGISTKEAIIA